MIDHIWVWRADHDQTDTTNTLTNEWQAKHNIINTGSNIIYYGLFAEHAVNNCVEFHGDDCKVYFFQNEAAYEFRPDKVGPEYLYNVASVPDRQTGSVGSKMYVDLSGNNIYSYYVADTVNTHTLMGAGVYTVFFHSDAKTGLYAMYKLPGLINKPNNYKNIYVVIISPNPCPNHLDIMNCKKSARLPTMGGTVYILDKDEKLSPNKIDNEGSFSWSNPEPIFITVSSGGVLGPIYLESTIQK